MDLHQKTFKELSEQEKSDNKEYSEFLEKFEPKFTTDDCFTPDLVYDAVADFVCSEFNLDRSNFVRPFYPGGDFEHFNYKPDSIVVDNPPFSILTKICRFYSHHHIKYFLFAPGMTVMCVAKDCTDISYLPTSVDIVYQNNATVNTSFVTNLYDVPQINSAPSLYKLVSSACSTLKKANKRHLPKYSYPDNVLTASKIANLSKHGIHFEVDLSKCHHIVSLEAQRKIGKAIFGSGFLTDDSAAAGDVIKFELSEKELEIISDLNKK